MNPSRSNGLGRAVGITTETTIVSSVNPTVTGQNAAFSATVDTSSGQPVTSDEVDFLVSFADGTDVLLGTGTLDANGQAQFTVNFLLPTDNEVYAAFQGSGNYLPSPSPLLDQQVNAADTSLQLCAASPTVVAGQADNLSATLNAVAPGAFVVNPTGLINFYDSLNGGTPILLQQEKKSFTNSTREQGLRAGEGYFSCRRNGTDPFGWAGPQHSRADLTRDIAPPHSTKPARKTSRCT